MLGSKCFWYSVLCGFHLQAAVANSPAPIALGNGVSSAVSLQSSEAFVRREKLSIDCRFASCEVIAQYDVQAARALKLEFQFITPHDSGIHPQINGQDVSVLKSGPVLNRGTVNPDSGAIATPFFSSTFRGPLGLGPNTLRVRYQQPLSLHLTRSYLLRSASGRVSFKYILGPLKEWMNKDQFELEIDLTWSLPKRGFIARLFGFGLREIKCYDDHRRALDTKQRVKRGERTESQIVQLHFTQEFPDVLNCEADVSTELFGVYDGDTEKFADDFSLELNK